MDILVGALMIALGLVVCFAGLRVFLITLPIIGFITGFFIGAAGTRAVLGEGFLSTTTGVVIGLAAGIALAVLAYVFWYVGALLSAASSGALIGSALMNGIGVTSGWVVFIGAAIGAILLFLIATAIALPVWIVIINSAFLGSSAVLGGVLLVFDQIDRADLGYGVAWAAIESSWFWLIAWTAIGTIGLLVQMRDIATTTLPGESRGAAQPA